LRWQELKGEKNGVTVPKGRVTDLFEGKDGRHVRASFPNAVRSGSFSRTEKVSPRPVEKKGGYALPGDVPARFSKTVHLEPCPERKGWRTMKPALAGAGQRRKPTPKPYAKRKKDTSTARPAANI